LERRKGVGGGDINYPLNTGEDNNYSQLLYRQDFKGKEKSFCHKIQICNSDISAIGWWKHLIFQTQTI